MSVQKDDSGKRWIAVETEVPGTPEEVWRAIATGPGVSAWFCPVEVEERVGGKTTTRMGGMVSTGTVAAWEPPRRMVAEGQPYGPDGPTSAIEWTVEASSGGNCTVRLVNSLFTDKTDWDDQLENAESGWPGMFDILRLYLRHFRGEECSMVRIMSPTTASQSTAWATFEGALGLADLTQGDAITTVQDDAPPLVGILEEVEHGSTPRALVRLGEPAPGIAFLSAFTMGGQVMVVIGFNLYGTAGVSALSGVEAAWQAWLGRRFPTITS